MEASSARQGRRRLASLGLLAGAALLSLAVAEALARFLDLAPELGVIEVRTGTGTFMAIDHPVLRYVPKPGAAGISSHGLRDREYPVEKPAGVFRVVVLGDSIGFGYCTARELLPPSTLFHERMEATLEKEAPPELSVEFLNLSVSGYGTEEEVAFLETRGLAFDPDLVIVAYCLNDDASYRYSEELRGLERDPRYRRARELAAGIRRSLLLESHLVRAVALRTGLLTQGDPESELRSGAGDYTERVARQLEPLGELAELHGFEVLLVVFPHLHRQQDGVYGEAPRHDVVLGAAREQGFHALDLLPAFLQAGGGELARLAGRCQAMHPDEEGHGVAAQAILEYLRGAGLLPAPFISEAD